MAGACFQPPPTDTIKAIIKKISKLSREIDENGWTPLHYATYNGILSTTKALLEFDTYATYIKGKHREMTPLLLAANQGHRKVVWEIVINCPDCCEIVDSRGWNVLYFIMIAFESPMIQASFILDYAPVAGLINNMDINGNTPLHVLAMRFDRTYDRTHLMKIWETEMYSVLDKRNMSAFNVMDYGSPKLKDEINKLCKKHNNGPCRRGVIRKYHIDSKVIRMVEKMKDAHLVVGALIATVTFTAAFTEPGGYKEEESKNPGAAILGRNSAFQAFVITNAIAMTLSVLAVCINFLLSIPRFEMFPHLDLWNLTMVSMGAMVIAFVTGTFSLVSSSLWLAVLICVIGLSFFIGVFYVIYNLGQPTSDKYQFCLSPSQWAKQTGMAPLGHDKLCKELNSLTSA